MPKRYRSKRRATEDASGLAGWLFTDLLLGLVMIFLSAVAFTADKSKDDETLLSVEKYEVCTEYFAAFIPEPLSLEFKIKDDAVNIGPQIQEYINTEQKIKGVKQKLKDAKVAVGIIYGSYEQGNKSDQGVLRARDFYGEFNKSDPKNFPKFGDGRKVQNMRFLGSKGDKTPRNGVLAELYFVYNQCGKTEFVTSTTSP